jgi:NAD(P)-dependent dehydrogenase (short-subunit alcohol dehydrogenase family)
MTAEQLQTKRADGWAGKVTVVTGAASGMGEAAARLLADGGAKVVLCDVNQEGLDALGGQLAKSAEVLTLPVDVGQPDSIRQAAEQVGEAYGRVDALLHFAAILDSHQLEELTVETWDRVLDVNLRGSFLMVQAIVPLMSPNGHGAVVLVASDSARHGSTVSGPAYAASKGGVIALTRGLAAYLGPRGLRVNAVCPGLAMTGMSRGWSQQVIDEVTRRTPLGRLAEAGDIAEVALFLASDSARWITGEVVEANGGFFFD